MGNANSYPIKNCLTGILTFFIIACSSVNDNSVAQPVTDSSVTQQLEECEDITVESTPVESSTSVSEPKLSPKLKDKEGQVDVQEGLHVVPNHTEVPKIEPKPKKPPCQPKKKPPIK